MAGPQQFSFANAQEAAPGSIKAGFEDDYEPSQPPARAKAKPIAPKNVVQMAKARLRDVKSELRRMKALEKECAELERLILAAENKPRAIVREIKRSAG